MNPAVWRIEQISRRLITAWPRILRETCPSGGGPDPVRPCSSRPRKIGPANGCPEKTPAPLADGNRQKPPRALTHFFNLSAPRAGNAQPPQSHEKVARGLGAEHQAMPIGTFWGRAWNE